MTIYDLSNDRYNTHYVKFVGPRPTELPLGTGSKMFTPNQLYLISDLAVSAATSADVSLYITQGLLVEVVANSSTVTSAVAADGTAISFSYASPKTFTFVGGATGVAPTGTTGVIVSYSCNKNFPNGLSLNPTTGVISGTPTGLTGTASAAYTITALNAAGEAATAAITITVTGSNTPSLSYGGSPLTWAMGAATGATATANNATIFSIDKNLPTGLTLNTSTGVISGTPTGATGVAAADYTVTATNAGGYKTTAVCNIAVTGNNTPNFAMATPLVFSAAAGATSVAPSAVSNVAAYSISGNLPNALTFNAVTGVIAGTPTGSTAVAADFTITALSAAGYSTTQVVNITVNQ